MSGIAGSLGIYLILETDLQLLIKSQRNPYIPKSKETKQKK